MKGLQVSLAQDARLDVEPFPHARRAARLPSGPRGTIGGRMSTHEPGSRAAAIAAQQVEAIVEAAEAAAADIRQRGEQELAAERARLEAEYDSRRQALEDEIAKLREAATEEADKVRAEAHEAAAREREEALAEAKRVRDEAQSAAAERVALAERAADDALADARAMSGGLRRLGATLEDYAERILRDVQTSHRRARGDPAD